MSNIDKQALRADALEATGGSWVRESGEGWEAICCDDDQGNAGFIIAEFHGENATANRKFVQSANPATVLALLDDLEAKDNRINRLEAIAAVAEQRNALMRDWKRALKVPCDLVDNQVPVVIHGMVIRLERLKETEDKLTAAGKRIAELEALARGVKQYSEFQICHYGATEDYAKGYIDCQNNYNKVLFAAAGKGEA